MTDCSENRQEGISEYPIADQLFAHSEKPCESLFSPPDPELESLKDGELTPLEIAETAGRRIRLMKPCEAGLWTSTRLTGKTSAWTKFLQHEAASIQNGDEKVWRLVPDEDVSIYTLDSVEAVREIATVLEERETTLENEFTGESFERVFRRYGIDFYSLSQEYDAVWLPAKSVTDLRLPGMEHPELTSWDVECTLWLSWCFNSVQLVSEELPSTSPNTV